MPFEITTLKQRPDLEPQLGLLAGESWPTFLLHGDITHWERLFDDFADLQLLVAVRKDLGHTNKGLDKGDLLRPFLKGVDEAVEADRGN